MMRIHKWNCSIAIVLKGNNYFGLVEVVWKGRDGPNEFNRTLSSSQYSRR